MNIFSYSIVTILLLMLILIGHLITVKFENEEKEYIDLKIQKQKTSLYNIIRDILLNILMFFVFICGNVYLKEYAFLVFLPSFFLLLYYADRKEKRRFNIFLFLAFLVAGLLAGSFVSSHMPLPKVESSSIFCIRQIPKIWIMLELVLFLFFLVEYIRVKLVGIFGIAIIALSQGLDNNTKFLLFVMYLLLAFLYERLRKISYIAIYIFSFCILKMQNSAVLFILLAILLLCYVKSTKKVVKKKKKTGIELGNYDEVLEDDFNTDATLIHFSKKEEKEDFVDFNIDEIQEQKEDFVKFNIEDMDD